MIGSRFSYLSQDKLKLLAERVETLLSDYGVKFDKHPEAFAALKAAGVQVDESTGMVHFPREVLAGLLALAPRTFTLGARNPERALPLPRPDGTFYTRTCTGGYGYLDPADGSYRKVTLQDLADWGRLVQHLDDISFQSFLFPDDAPLKTADVHALATNMKNVDKHLWVQPYSAESVSHLIKLAGAAAGGMDKLPDNPVVSMIACSLTPRAFKHMDLEIIVQSARAGLPIQACSLPGAGGTAPATIPGVAVLAAAEILAMTALAQAVKPGTPVVACPIIFSTDMRSGRSLQSAVEAMRGASLAVQFLKSVWGLPTHDYGSGADSPIPDEQSMSERAMLTTWMAATGLDILGGAGQLEVATVVSPLQLMVDNEVFAMARGMVRGMEIDEDQLAWEVLTTVKPGDHFMMTGHTLSHCRDGLEPQNFIRATRDAWEREGSRTLMQRVAERYGDLMAQPAPGAASADLAGEIDALVAAADRELS